MDNTGSFATKRTYLQAMKQFLEVCSEHFNAQNIKNLSNKHIRYFVEEQLDNGVSQRTLQKQVAGIKHFLLLAGAKVTVTNSQLGIAGRKYQVLEGISPTEYQRALDLCSSLGKEYERLAIKAMYWLGLRSNEVVNLRYATLCNALASGVLLLEHGTKGGRKRSFVLGKEQLDVIRELEASRLNPDGHCGSDKVFCSRQKGAVKSQKSRLHQFFVRYADRIADSGRTDPLSCHSFRRTFAQKVYDRVRATKSDTEAMNEVKIRLGHSASRGLDVTGVYVKDRQTECNNSS